MSTLTSLKQAIEEFDAANRELELLNSKIEEVQKYSFLKDREVKELKKQFLEESLA